MVPPRVTVASSTGPAKSKAAPPARQVSTSVARKQHECGAA